MKNFVIGIMETMLNLTIIVATIGGFILAGNANPFGDFSFGMALLGALIGFLASAVASGGIFVLLRIKELLEEQLQQMKNQGAAK